MKDQAAILVLMRLLLSALEDERETETRYTSTDRDGRTTRRGVWQQAINAERTLFEMYARRSDGVKIGCKVYKATDLARKEQIMGELWELLDREDPLDVELADEQAVERALRAMDEGKPLPPESPVWPLLERSLGKNGAEGPFSRMHKQKRRVRQRYNRDVSEQGRDCKACGERFQPKTVRTINCPDCIACRRGGTA